MNPKRPIVDLVQVFCSNFESHLDLSGPRSRRRQVEWPPFHDMSEADVVTAKISRYTLEVFNLVLSGEGDHLIPDVLAYYVALPVQRIASSRAIAYALTRSIPPLSDGSVMELETIITGNLFDWKQRAAQLLAQGPKP